MCNELDKDFLKLAREVQIFFHDIGYQIWAENDLAAVRAVRKRPDWHLPERLYDLGTIPFRDLYEKLKEFQDKIDAAEAEAEAKANAGPPATTPWVISHGRVATY